jgi:two-component system, response regulator RegA
MENAFDVMVLDLKMPCVEGTGTIREMNKLGLVTEVLILTGHGSIDLALEALQMSVYDFITKPCGIEDIVSKIEAAFERKKSRLRKNQLNPKSLRGWESASGHDL